jgi:DNA-binding HxlR family transcriptional regulator
MSNSKILSVELQRLIEQRLRTTLEGIEDTLDRVGDIREISLTEMKLDLDSLEKTFHQLFQKWNLGILYTLFLKDSIGFNEIKNALGVNSRTLSDKLKLLAEFEYVKREVFLGPPLRVEYSLTKKGRNTILLAIPLLYYSRSRIIKL